MEGTRPSFDLSRAGLCGGVADPGSAAGRHPGRGFAHRKHAERGEGSPGYAPLPKHPRCSVEFRRAGGQSHMMSQTMTQAGCLNPTQRLSCTMSHPGHPARRVRGANTWPHAPRPYASRGASPRQRGSWPSSTGQGAGRRAPRAGWRAGDDTGSGGWVTRR